MKKLKLFSIFSGLIIFCIIIPVICYAQPYGVGAYNLITYGSQTSLSISTDGPVTMPTVTPTAGGSMVTKNSTVTVTSTDIKGYTLYLRAATNTYMNNLGAQLPTSAHTYSYPNVIGTGLEVNTWGFNTDQGSNFAGISSTDTKIYETTLPMVSGHNTVITYGINLDFAKPAGNYTADVVYTAVPQPN